jgi:sugar phosphate isomerase/epimerase
MLPLKIGACLKHDEIAAHRDWLLDADRDLELQDFMSPEVLSGDWRPLVDAARAALAGHGGRLGIHGPFRGLPIDCEDPEIRPIVTHRYLTAVEICEALGARQMVLHSPYDAWFDRNRHCFPGYVEGKIARVHDTMAPVLRRAEDAGVTLVVENIQDVTPGERRALVESFDSDAIALSVDTGHAHLARHMSGAPPVDYFIADAGAQLAHVHLQDVDGHADRHWAMGDGDIAWFGVFAALSRLDHAPHLVLELRDKVLIPRAFDWLTERGLAC